MAKLQLSASEILTILREHHLLTNVINANDQLVVTDVTYDSRTAKPNGLFFCKGNFKPEYLTTAVDAGVTAYVSEVAAKECKATGFIVADIQKAMSLLSAAFFGYPQDDLFIVAFTGTKGKTTSAYFTRGILQQTTNKHTALFSTIDRILGPKPEQEFKSDLTTPESLNLFHDMREAVDSGMTTLVMEVSSQAYKKNRVYGLTYDVGIFLNITPDHIGRNEHPTFADYLHCKLQLLVNSRQCIINAETDHLEDIYMAAKATTEPEDIYMYARDGYKPSIDVPIDFRYHSNEDTLKDAKFTVSHTDLAPAKLNLDGEYQLALPGDYNENNAVASIIAAGLAGATATEAQQTLPDITVPGRFESVATKNHGMVFVDYAHNYASVKALLSFLRKQYADSRIIVVVGSPGDKGISRREGFGKALNEEADVAYLTADDPGFENPADIAQQIDEHIDHNRVDVHVQIDRPTAIREAISDSHADDVVVLAAKGEDPYQKIRGVDTPYPTDMAVAKQVIADIEA
ncbi:UDP-N-acetylmuramoyl-L-alanyl-D-glutamate--2,6-diaminopimelate ligase [Furfurilactobacillus milii]|uniref:UDP-N-acetylmuramyl-tripeptide synthetase n=1 Tax=Furfurilactobacillus milii TaxID=2888272 RepID=A0ABT6D8L8_9LACO|nr:UDP-N-acetylmuramoyl-L-alanyl-D-glutamate--2,6-diaminopimelate ligase [Furfurilactobacillus milii]QLE66786.1 UDP-N-acetylmuramoylalanyl-D-glutamate--L-lysine ligase [Furfurilactobacillus rossiae]MCF6160671.1 UDP-N-acetylmuramoyl-L-alanyl-D-glutamate--2,6-diaminopimelate ligase [Furfurilactobacillus milii]MCF6162903.1 UDP-N-acetylmuramoyl-L-alanyl-D-glutamate--2,6-diaminopimelate ligase [Furfurilactobacillus milii]MCF6420177.1 UDP-N-acetylmuramoyl-L-alanyl-D-glutamate--2,6-diaminopimelate lig